MIRQLVDDASRARVADVELPLHQRDRCAALGRNGSSRASKKRIELALLAPLPSLPLGTRTLFEDLFHVSRTALRLPAVDDAFHVGAAGERALEARRLPRIGPLAPD